jgi:predicted metal-dependent enzyme (double-stranded beta helix superfamily)
MLQKTERFQSDIKKYIEIINNMSDEQTKLESKKLLNDLIYEVKNMDNMYVDMVYARQLPTMGNDIREKIVSIRKQLDQKINKST